MSDVGSVKFNTNGATKGCLGHEGDIFRGSCGEYIDNFSSYLGVQKYFYFEVMTTILALRSCRLMVILKCG